LSYLPIWPRSCPNIANRTSGSAKAGVFAVSGGNGSRIGLRYDLAADNAGGRGRPHQVSRRSARGDATANRARRQCPPVQQYLLEAVGEAHQGRAVDEVVVDADVQMNDVAFDDLAVHKRETSSRSSRDVIDVPAGVKHAFRNVSTEGVSTLIVTTMAPARFLRQMGRPIADVLHRLEEPVQHSQKLQVACGKNGTSAAIPGKRRLLSEICSLSALPAAGGRRMTSIKQHASKLLQN
jgi:hypothetical protein